MDAELSMNRLIHAAVRRDLVRIEGGLRTMPAGDRARAEELQATWDNLRAQLTRHHEGEDTHIWPWLESVGVDPELLATMESEHEGLARALRECAQAIGVATSTAARADAQSAAEVVARARGVVDRHLEHEELELEPLMHAQLGTPGWKAVERKLRAASPVEAGGSSRGCRTVPAGRSSSTCARCCRARSCSC